MDSDEKGLRQLELHYRDKEIRYTRRGFWLNSIAVFLGLLTALAAVFAALQAARAVSAGQASAERQAREQRLANSVQALGGSKAAQRIAGVSMMTHSVTEELHRVTARDTGLSGSELASRRDDAEGAYLSVLDALENYVGGWRSSSTLTAGPEPSPPSTPKGRDTPRTGADYSVPRDVIYAAGSLKALLGSDVQSAARRLDLHPSIDLAAASLWGASLPGFDAGWLAGHWFRGIDLRGATLTGSTWGTSYLGNAKLQCAELGHASFVAPHSDGTGLEPGADLEGADLRGANLRYVDLRGADLRNVNFRGARMLGAHLRGADITGADFRGSDHPGVRFDRSIGRESARGVRGAPRPPLDSRDECLDVYWNPSSAGP